MRPGIRKGAGPAVVLGAVVTALVLLGFWIFNKPSAIQPYSAVYRWSAPPQCGAVQGLGGSPCAGGFVGDQLTSTVLAEQCGIIDSGSTKVVYGNASGCPVILPMGRLTSGAQAVPGFLSLDPNANPFTGFVPLPKASPPTNPCGFLLNLPGQGPSGGQVCVDQANNKSFPASNGASA